MGWHHRVMPQQRQLPPASQMDGMEGQGPLPAQGGCGGSACEQGSLTAPASGGTPLPVPEQSHAWLEMTH